ncbi:hypothetical protein BDY17DRAFT_302900 [Neohortaea acidophila]|uniref:Uncharacterized protein n=1 Tax=Neohortaea acidophila TaxID=245834 RepID=A0A6A6PKW2_9PEZI|nr:uncharacterized protein BDY17DRAFT_302900 [Neohortaea acidophila]KAF2479907.1 hypothetical protein BDY17DRAFT_302900 [Neohortaea acidophila]
MRSKIPPIPNDRVCASRLSVASLSPSPSPSSSSSSPSTKSGDMFKDDDPPPGRSKYSPMCNCTEAKGVREPVVNVTLPRLDVRRLPVRLPYRLPHRFARALHSPDSPLALCAANSSYPSSSSSSSSSVVSCPSPTKEVDDAREAIQLCPFPSCRTALAAAPVRVSQSSCPALRTVRKRGVFAPPVRLPRRAPGVTLFFAPFVEPK